VGGSSIEHLVSRIGWVVGKRAHRARGDQWAQEKPLGQLEADGQATSGADEVLAKLDSKRSTFSPSHLGHLTPSLPAPTFCRREKLFPQSLHRYSYIGIFRTFVRTGSGFDLVTGLEIHDFLAALENCLAVMVDPQLERVADVAADREDAVIDDPVIDVESRAATIDEAGAFEHREVLGNVGLASADHLEDVGDATLAIVEAMQDLETRRVGHRLEDLCDPIEQFV
jgi:hypothetical protein